jgi:hypothetical protein
VENPSASLVFSYVGYVTQTIPVNSKTVIDVAMSEEVVALNELVVIGYGTQRRADLTGSIAVLMFLKSVKQLQMTLPKPCRVRLQV